MSTDTDRFYYFAYGSNMLSQRIVLSNPSAKFVGVGKLADHRLIYCRRDEACAWGPNAATASIDGTAKGHDVYGAVWTLDKADTSSLDAQEGVPWLYRPEEVQVRVQDKQVNCRTYVMLDHTPALPSPFYLDVVLRGAVQTGLPKEYLEEMRRQKHNDYLGKCDIYDKCRAVMPPEERDKFEVEVLREHFRH